MASTKDTLIAAVHALYHGQPHERQPADEWLKTFQQSMESWSVVDELLRAGPTVPAEVSFIAANTMRQKLRKSFNEIPAESREALKASLLTILEIHKEGALNTQTQLCLAVAELALQMVEWKDAVKDLITNFGNTLEHLPGLLQILCVLSEEVDDAHGPLADSVIGSSLLVMQYLHHWFPQTEAKPRWRALILRCFARWLRFIKSPANDIAASAVVTLACGDGLGNEQLFQEAVEVVTELARRYGDDPTEQAPLIAMLMSKMPMFQACYDKGLADEDNDLCRGACRIVSEIGEATCPHLVDHANAEAIAIVTLLLRCTQHSSESVSAVTFNFWYTFSKRLNHSADDAKRATYQPAFAQLVDTLSAASAYPEEAEDWSGDQEEEFRDFRHSVADALLDACTIVGGVPCVERTLPKLAHLIEECKAGSDKWTQIESQLYCVRSVARLVGADDACVGQVLALHDKLPNHWRLRYTMTLLVGRYAHWVSKHPEALPPLFHYVAGGLGQKETAGASAMSLKYLCESCAVQMTDAVREELFRVYEHIATLAAVDQSEVIRGLGAVLTKLPEHALTPALERLLVPLATTLTQAATAATAGHPVVPQQVAGVYLRLTTLFQAIAGSESLSPAALHRVVPIIGAFWPHVDSSFDHYVGDADVADHMCRCLKQVFRLGGPAFDPIVTRTTQRLTAAYQSHHHSAFLYAMNACIATFGDMPSRQAELLHCMETISSHTFTMLGAKGAFDTHPDIVEEYFELSARCLRRFPEPFLAKVGDTIVACGVAGLALQHPSACECVLSFFDTLISCEPPKGVEGVHPLPSQQAKVNSLLATHGQNVVNALINGACGGLPSSLVTRVNDVLRAFVVTKHPHFPAWLQTAVAALPAGRPDDAARHEFMQAFASAPNRGAQNDVLWRLSSTCRVRNFR